MSKNEIVTAKSVLVTTPEAGPLRCCLDIRLAGKA
jgi:hypothetical protein